MNSFDLLKNEITSANFKEKSGYVIEVSEGYIKTKGPNVPLNSFLKNNKNDQVFKVVKTNKEYNLLFPLSGEISLIKGEQLFPVHQSTLIPKETKSLFGTVNDAFVQPFSKEHKIDEETINLNHFESKPINPMQRKRISEPMETGIKAIDGLLTIGRGQKIGVFAGTGVGKSTLLSMIAKNSNEDVNVIVLTGERGREVKDFIERDLGEEGMKKTIMIVATSEEPPLKQIEAVENGTKIAQLLREQGKNVLLMMDSITRYLMAKRTVDMANGEIPVMNGKTPSMEPSLQRILEKAGSTEKGSITGIYTVLVEGDDFNGVIPDMARGILDGHIILRRTLADQNIFPAIDILDSISRVMKDITPEKELNIAKQFKKYYSLYKENEDQIQLGLVEKGRNKELDRAIQIHEVMKKFIQQDIEEVVPYEQTKTMMKQILSGKARV